jgi:cyclopropane fatty-acyl-phospholipid synthase-like methyltransferase
VEVVFMDSKHNSQTTSQEVQRQPISHRKYRNIVAACESYLEEYGDNYLGVGWTKKKEYADRRYRVMLELIRGDTRGNVTLLDFGCGASHLYEYILQHELSNIEYNGLDLSEKFISLSKSKFPSVSYYLLDVLDDRSTLPVFDYVVFNGVFTMKCDLTFDEMFEYFQAVVSKVFDRTRIGVAFNVMSKQVEWEREDLFHLPFDPLASFLTKNISRNFVMRHDYKLYEYTTYVYR